MRLAAGQRLGPYEIVAPIGAGGMGEVYRARDTRLDRTVAIKVLGRHLAGDPDVSQRFEREARIVARLEHPHICPLYDVGSLDEISYLVMQHLTGETLAERLRQGRLPVGEAIARAIEIVEGIEAAHRQGVVHRDLKPGNIMITPDGAKLLDFGLAKLWTRPAGPASDLTGAVAGDLTRNGAILGTIAYMAPEQLDGRPVDARTDIFGFGGVLYEMLTGKRAFDAPTQAGVIGAILHQDPPSIRSQWTDVPPALEQIARRCLEKDPGARWQTAADLRAALTALAPTHHGSGRDQAVVPEMPIPGVPDLQATVKLPSGPAMPAPARRPSWSVAAGIGAGVLAIVAGLSWLRPASPARSGVPPSARSESTPVVAMPEQAPADTPARDAAPASPASPPESVPAREAATPVPATEPARRPSREALPELRRPDAPVAPPRAAGSPPGALSGPAEAAAALDRLVPPGVSVELRLSGRPDQPLRLPVIAFEPPGALQERMPGARLPTVPFGRPLVIRDVAANRPLGPAGPVAPPGAVRLYVLQPVGERRDVLRERQPFRVRFLRGGWLAYDGKAVTVKPTEGEGSQFVVLLRNPQP
jgi:serine/threonine protein kinase